MMFSKKGKKSENVELKMTAMIDVVFQLLIFFLVGTKFRVPEGELEAYLPEEGAPTNQTRRLEEVDEIRVSLLVSHRGATGEPRVLIDNKRVQPGSRFGKSPMAWLESELFRLGKSKAMRDEVPIIISAEPDLSYKWVIATLNTCRKARFKKVNFAASARNAPDPFKGKAPPGAP
jgi:biopolymer transport protein ExbD